jgi:hypothetical protein
MCSRDLNKITAFNQLFVWAIFWFWRFGAASKGRIHAKVAFDKLRQRATGG